MRVARNAPLSSPFRPAPSAGARRSRSPQGTAQPPQARRNDRVELARRHPFGRVRPQDARHNQGGGVPFLDLDEAAVAVSSLTKTGARIINFFAGSIAFLGAWSAAGELCESGSELPDLEAQRRAFDTRPPPAAEVTAPNIINAARRNHRAGQQRVTEAYRTAVAKTALGVPSCLGALTMGLSVFLGPDLLGALFPTAAAASALMAVAVPCIAVFGVGTAVLHALQATRQCAGFKALRGLATSQTQQAPVRQFARRVLEDQSSLWRWRVGGAAAGMALGIGVFLSYALGPIGLALLLPGALALPLCNAMIDRRAQYAAPTAADLSPGPEEAAPGYQDAADAQTYAGTLGDVACAAAVAAGEQAACKAAARLPVASPQIDHAAAPAAPRSEAPPANSPQADHGLTPEQAFYLAYRDILEARLPMADRAGDSAEALRQAVLATQNALAKIDVAARPWHSLNLVLHTLNAEDAMAPLMERLQDLSDLWRHLPKVHNGHVVLTATQVRRAVEKLPADKQAACVRTLCDYARQALLRTVQADAAARERHNMSHFAAVANFMDTAHLPTAEARP